ncbi:hypothetical protein CWE12_05375 [Aliidiomarina sedimenti]|uniref:Uncharacterized protein n=1 Tax=Aliidiomarina sedimenti TaxID=1933879 RepID=A0ABY0BZT8_9GAMM|nr:hypothetical protein [Aliidiomarina sedimenti]RUO30676.1 hypothetical protein CWE12_05375 [Aliidiomarina sedimenti]
MNVTAQPVSFLPTTAAQPTDVLRRDNTTREVISPMHANEAFNRERGLGTDSERRPLPQDRSYAQQLAEARIESGFPNFLNRVEERQQGQGERQQGDRQQEQQSEAVNSAEQDAKPATLSSDGQLQRDDDRLNTRFSDLSREWGTAKSPAAQTTLTWRNDDGSYQTSVNIADNGAAVDPQILARGERIEQFYQSSYRPKERFLLGVA